jgi:hypothetical protein
MILYYAEILDLNKMPVLSLEYTTSAKHSAFLALQFIDNCPPAQGFAIRKRFLEAKTICKIINQKGE